MRYNYLAVVLVCVTFISVSAGKYSFNLSRVAGPVGNTVSTIDGGAGCIEALDDRNAVFFGGDRSVALITNGGGTIVRKNVWEGEPSGSDSCFSFNAMDFYDDHNGFIVGFNSIIYKTVDGGKTWRCSMHGTPRGVFMGVVYGPELLSVCTFDSNNIWAAGESGYIVHSTDGGTTWSEMDDSAIVFDESNVFNREDYRLTSIAVVNKSVCYVAGNHNNIPILLKTIDGGMTWREVVTRRFGEKLVAIAASGTSLWIMTRNTVDHGICMPDSYGVKWDEKWWTAWPSLQSLVVVDSTFVVCIDSMAWVRVVKGDSSRSAICQSSHNLEINAITPAKNGVLWAKSKLGIIYRSTDSGASWTGRGLNGMNATAGLNAVCFADPSRGWIGGDQGTFWETTDSGKTWHACDSTVQASIYYKSIACSNAGIGWALGTTWPDDTVYLSSDTGTSCWQKINPVFGRTSFLNLPTRTRYPLSPDTMLEVGEAISDSRIFTLTGGSKELLAIVDHAESRSAGFTSITFSTPSTGWVTGYNGIFRSTDRGIHWNSYPNPPGTFFEKICFFSPRYGAILGMDRLLFTGDSGVTWDEVPILSAAINDITMSDSMSCWAVGAGGVLLHLSVGTVRLAVVTPEKGDSFHPGDTVSVAWEGTGQGSVSIAISYDNGLHYTTYCASTPDDGRETIRIAANAAPGSSCILTIQSTTTTDRATSERFTIRDPASAKMVAGRSGGAVPVEIHGSAIHCFSRSAGIPIAVRLYSVAGQQVFRLVTHTVRSGSTRVRIPENAVRNGRYLAEVVIGEDCFRLPLILCR